MGLSLIGKFLLYTAGIFFIVGLIISGGNFGAGLIAGFVGILVGAIVVNIVGFGAHLFEK